MHRTIAARYMAIAAAGVFVCTAAQAETYTIYEQGKRFDYKEITISKGDSITFVNQDIYTHNVYSVTKGHEFDFGAQEPERTVTFEFTNPGEVVIRCAIHPKMKLRVTVTP